MRVLVTGGSGFIGSAIVAALRRRGHRVIAGVHRAATVPPGVERLPMDFMRDTTPESWLPRLDGVDAVVNAVGILRETRAARFDAVHHLAPRALFAACQRRRVRRVIQISALGADAAADSRYHRSKRAADDGLRATDLEWTVVQPSLVFGTGGASTRLFLMLASLPVVPLIGRGDQRLQPIHIDDLAALVVNLVERDFAYRQTIAAVGPAAMTLRELLLSYRRSLGLSRPVLLPVPLALIRLGARGGDLLRSGALSTETIAMLLRGNTDSDAATRKVLGRPARPVEGFIDPAESGAWRIAAVWSWMRPLMLASLAAIWIIAGVVSWTHGQDHGLALLGRMGLDASGAFAALAAACGLNIVLGVAMLLRPSRSLWWVQLAVIAVYSAALTVVAPGLWTDPFGPLAKNLPIAALLIGLTAADG